MPELAEVYWFARRWSGGVGQKVARVEAPESRVFRHETAEAVRRALTGQTLLACESRGKQASFVFSGNIRLGIHLGMTGRLFVAADRDESLRFFGDGEANRAPQPRHDRLTLHLASGAALVFNDPRMFGLVRLHEGVDTPDWWREAGPDPTSPEFPEAAVRDRLARLRATPLKAVLLRQDLFPGIGNWMADETLFHARLRPDRPVSALRPRDLDALFAAVRAVASGALATVGRGDEPPADWLFHRRWRPDLTCPKTGKKLARATIAGRTTCWSPAWQK